MNIQEKHKHSSDVAYELSDDSIDTLDPGKWKSAGFQDFFRISFGGMLHCDHYLLNIMHRVNNINA